MKGKKQSPIHLGEILREELLIPNNMSPSELFTALKIPKEQIQWICEESGDITLDLAVRLSLYFDSSVEFWLNIQRSYDREVRRKLRITSEAKDKRDFNIFSGFRLEIIVGAKNHWSIRTGSDSWCIFLFEKMKPERLTLLTMIIK